MQELKRLRRILSVRTTQRDLSALRLLQARHRTDTANAQLTEAEAQLRETDSRVSTGHQVSTTGLERLDLDRAAARAERDARQMEAWRAQQAQTQARDHVEAQHRLLRQSEQLTDQAAKRVARHKDSVEQKAADEQAGRKARERP